MYSAALPCHLARGGYELLVFSNQGCAASTVVGIKAKEVVAQSKEVTKGEKITT